MSTDPPRVLVLTSTFPRFRGDHIGRFLGEYVDEIDLPVIVLAPATHQAAPEESWSPNVRVRRFAAPEGIAYGGGIPANLRRRPTLAASVPRFLYEWSRTAAELAADADVIDAHWAVPGGAVGLYLARRTGLPLRLVLHSGGVHALGGIPLGKAVANRLSNRAEAITAVSRATAERFQALTGQPKPIDVVSMGIRAERSGGPSSDRSVGFRGRLVPIKGVDLLITACATAGAELTIAGAGPEQPQLEEHAQRAGCRAHFVGPSDATPNTAVVAFPSRVMPTGRAEGTPVSLLEAMSAGAAIVATRAGGVEDVIDDGKNGVLVPPGDLGQLTSALLRLLDDPALRARLGAQAKEDAQAYLWSTIAPQHREILCRVARAS